MSTVRSSPTDESLVAAWMQRGDTRAASRLLRRYVHRLDAYFRVRSCPGLVQELRQQTLIQVARSIHRYRQESSFRAYLFGVAYNTLRAHLAKSRRGRGRFEAATWSLEDVHGELAHDPTLDDTHDLLTGLHALPVEQRDLLQLHYVHGLTNAEIGEIMGCPANTVQYRRARAEHHLAKLLGEVELRQRGPARGARTRGSSLVDRLRRLGERLVAATKTRAWSTRALDPCLAGENDCDLNARSCQASRASRMWGSRTGGSTSTQAECDDPPAGRHPTPEGRR